MKARRSRGDKRTYPERGIHPPHTVVSRCKSGEGVTSPKDTAPTRGSRWSAVGVVVIFFGGPAGAAVTLSAGGSGSALPVGALDVDIYGAAGVALVLTDKSKRFCGVISPRPV